MSLTKLSLAGMSPIKLSLTENNLIIHGKGELGKWSRLGTEKSLTFLQCRGWFGSAMSHE
jgi:hypothetical protein